MKDRVLIEMGADELEALMLTVWKLWETSGDSDLGQMANRLSEQLDSALARIEKETKSGRCSRAWSWFVSREGDLFDLSVSWSSKTAERVFLQGSRSGK